MARRFGCIGSIGKVLLTLWPCSERGRVLACLYMRSSQGLTKSLQEFDKGHSLVPTGQRLWLTKRFGKGPGFVVLVRNSTTINNVVVLTAVSFGVEAGMCSKTWAQYVKCAEPRCTGSPGNQKFPLLPMNWNSDSTRSLEVAKSWLRNCIENHENCAEGTPTLPSRVLDISSSNDIIRLVDGSGLSGRYASLSYCVSNLLLSFH